jgi:hypothetical protein
VPDGACHSPSLRLSFDSLPVTFRDSSPFFVHFWTRFLGEQMISWAAKDEQLETRVPLACYYHGRDWQPFDSPERQTNQSKSDLNTLSCDQRPMSLTGAGCEKCHLFDRTSEQGQNNVPRTNRSSSPGSLSAVFSDSIVHRQISI